MRKTIVSAFVVFAAFLASVEKAEAQSIRDVECFYYQVVGNDFRRLTCERMRMLEQQGADLRRVRLQGPIYGKTDRKGVFQQTDERGRPLPKTNRQRIEQTGGIIAIADGTRRILNDPRGPVGWIEAAVGGALILDSRQRGEQRQKDDGTRVVPPPDRRPDHDVVVGRDGIPVAVGSRPLVGPAAWDQSDGEFTLINSTRFSVEVYDGKISRGRMRPGQQWKVNAPKEGYVAYAIIPNVRGALTEDKTDIQPTDDGWMFTEPNFKGSGR